MLLETAGTLLTEHGHDVDSDWASGKVVQIGTPSLWVA